MVLSMIIVGLVAAHLPGVSVSGVRRHCRADAREERHLNPFEGSRLGRCWTA